MVPSVSSETMEIQKLMERHRVLKEKNRQFGMLYPAKMPFKHKRIEIKTFPDQ